MGSVWQVLLFPESWKEQAPAGSARFMPRPQSDDRVKTGSDKVHEIMFPWHSDEEARNLCDLLSQNP